MKIEYRTAVAGSAYSTLFDESVGDVSSAFKVSFKDLVQVTSGFGANSESITPQSNTVVSLQIPLSKMYASRAAAKAGIRAYRALKGLSLNLKITEEADVDFYPKAAMETMEANLTGQAVDFMFHFQSQDVTTNDLP
jgi:hypothetical protein